MDPNQWPVWKQCLIPVVSILVCIPLSTIPFLLYRLMTGVWWLSDEDVGPDIGSG